jgi:hydroxymethylglutaryl-CoA reductase
MEDDPSMDVSGFYKLSIEERQKKIKQFAGLSDEEISLLNNTGALKPELADRMIENVIGAIHLPLGIATNFKINDKELVIPMAVEEPSIIAGASRAAKLTLPDGFKAEADESVMIGQIQIVDIPDIDQARRNLENSKSEILDIARQFMAPHEKWGAGVVDFNDRPLKIRDKDVLIVEFDINVSDAMGANMVNTALEGVAPTIATLTEGKVRLRIITNLATKRMVRARAVWKKELIGEDTVNGVIEGYEFAKADIYRCATHNKGIMNGIDALVLATANDWRAVEAGAHAYASMGEYKPLTTYEKTENGDLIGRIALPMAVATVGGAVNSSPTAKLALKIMDIKTSKDLAMACACIGLANNFAALSALATIGIQSGHMKLHARNIAVIAGAVTPEEIDAVADTLAKNKNYNSEFAKEVLEKIKSKE